MSRVTKFSAAPASLGTLYAVGVGPGDPELITLKALRTLETCPVIAAVRSEGGRSRRRSEAALEAQREAGSVEGASMRAASLSSDESAPNCRAEGASGPRGGATTALDIVRGAVDLAGKRIVELTFAMSRDAETLRASHAAAADAVCAELAAGHDVAMPILGDPSIYSTFHYIRPLVEAAGFHVRVIPGVPSFCAVAATLGANLTPTMGSPLHVLPTGYVDVREALDLPGTKVFMKAGAPLDELRDALRERSLLDRAGLVQDCGLPTQVVVGGLDELDRHDGDDPEPASQLGGYFTTVVVR